MKRLRIVVAAVGLGVLAGGAVAAETAEPVDNPQDGSTVVFGIDWAYSHDFTVIVVLDVVTNTMLYMDRFNGTDYTLQRERIQALASRFDPMVVISETNSMGRPNNEELRKAGLPVQDFTTTNSTKAVIIESMAGAFERGVLTVLNDPVLIGELQAYEGKQLPGGATRYSAPAGMHDDIVIALALAYSGSTIGPAFL